MCDSVGDTPIVTTKLPNLHDAAPAAGTAEPALLKHFEDSARLGGAPRNRRFAGASFGGYPSAAFSCVFDSQWRTAGMASAAVPERSPSVLRDVAREATSTAVPAKSAGSAMSRPSSR